MPTNLEQNPIHLCLGATAVSEPVFTGMDWYGLGTQIRQR